MKSGICISAFLAITIAISTHSCKKESNCEEKNISSYNSIKSHNMGQNCLNCHKSGGAGEGCFTAAGTVYNNLATSTYPNATIKLYSEPNGNGTVVATIEGDSKGNFHTTHPIDWGNGLYPAVTNTLGQTVYMSISTSNGACNSCHGVSKPRISTF